MSQLKKSVITLKRGVDVDAFINEMQNVGSTTPYIPTRSVKLHNLKPESLRNVDFLLTYPEVETLRNDPRVQAVRWGTKAENSIVILPLIIDTEISRYTRSPEYVISDKSDLNWGLIDCYSNTNPFTGNTRTILGRDRAITLTGNGVDVVIMDTGLQVDHPEFTDANGVSRVQRINWWASANQSGTPPWTPNASQNNMPSGFYTDTDGHGTHVGSIATGKNYGWATNANIYVMNVLGQTGSISPTLGFNLVRLWHDNKPLDPQTGYKRPTIINCSFGSEFANAPNFTGGNYQGRLTWEGTLGSNAANDYGVIETTGYPIWNVNNPSYPISEASINADVEEAIASGVIVIAAAGNNGYKIDISGGTDYNNYVTGNSISTIDGNRWYYHRGSSPASADGVIVVGAVDYTYNAQATGNPVSYPSYTTANSTAKAYFSACGPKVDVYAPGGMIAGATCTTAENTIFPYPVTTYYLNPSFKQQKTSGTSQASPQVTGIISCVLESNPNFNASDAALWISQNSITTKLANIATPNTNPYLDKFNLQGSPNRYLYMPYQTGVVANVTGSGNITGGGVNL